MDIIVHINNIPLLFNKYKVGFGLWNYPFASLRTEIILLGLGSLIYLWNDNLFSRKHFRTLIFLILVLFVYIGSYFAPAVEPSALQIALTSLTLYTSITGLGWWIERENK